MYLLVCKARKILRDKSIFCQFYVEIEVIQNQLYSTCVGVFARKIHRIVESFMRNILGLIYVV